MVLRDSTKRNKKLELLCSMTQDKLKQFLFDTSYVNGEGFLYKKGTFPVLLCAHMDTVHKYTPETYIYVNGTLSSPQGIGGDDRCGIYIIMEILKKYDCSVLFLEDEEVGCEGAKAFVKTDICKGIHDIKYMIEFDRRGGTDAVTYSCENKEFDEFIEADGYFKKATGTCSDISILMPELGVAGVNLSCGFHHEHNLHEYIMLEEMENTIKEACKILDRTNRTYDYIKSVTATKWGLYDYGYDYYNSNHKWTATKWNITYYDYELETNVTTNVEAYSEEVALGKFMKSHPDTCYKEIHTIEKIEGGWK